MMDDPSKLADIEKPEGEAIRQAIRDAVPKQAEQFHSMGQQFGYIYDSPAILDDGTPAEPSTISDYRPTAHPGARLPHVWLKASDDQMISAIDLFDHRFLLLTGRDGQAWIDAAATHSDMVKAVAVGDGHALMSAYPQTPFLTAYGIGEDGAVLVRPDNHVAARFAQAPDNIAAALADALARILQRPQLRAVA